LKCRWPVKTMAAPAWLTASMVSWSLHGAAGLDDGGHAGLKEELGPSGKGKKASLAATAPAARSAGFGDGEASGAGAIHLAGAGAEEHSDLCRRRSRCS
jgi:hypothetical protein